MAETSENLHVAVVLSDPRLSYSYSVDGRFGEKKIEGARKAQAVLETVDGYRFTCLGDHERLIDALREDSPDGIGGKDTAARAVERWSKAVGRQDS